MKTCSKCLVPKPTDAFYARAGRCKSCVIAYQRDRYTGNPEAMRQQARDYAASHREEAKARANKWYENNRGRALANVKAYQSKRTPEQLEKQRAAVRAWQKANLARDCEKVMRYLACKKNATPVWVTSRMLLPFYEEARRLTEDTGVPHEVDHFIPLQGKTVSGLHTPANLRVVPRQVNRKKSNRLIPEAMGCG